MTFPTAEAQTINQALLAACQRHAESPCLRLKRNGRYQDISYRRFEELALRMAHHLRRRGAGGGERVALLAGNSLEWLVSYVGCLLAGAVVVPVGVRLAPAAVARELTDSGARWVVISDRMRADLAGVLKQLPELEGLIVVDPPGEFVEGAKQVAMRSILSAPLDRQARNDLRQAAAGVAADAPAVVLYADHESGTARGALFDQSQRLATARNIAGWFEFGQDEVAFTVMPWEFQPSLDATLHYLLSGVANALAETRQAAFEDVQQVSPTVMLTIPSGLERFYREVMIAEMESLPSSSQEMFRWALAIGRQYRQAGGQVERELRDSYRRADLTFFSRIRGRIGGRVRRVYSTSAPMPRVVAEHIGAIGLHALDVYSVTEAGGFPTASRPDEERTGSCGQVVAGYELRIAADGEVLVRGPAVMTGYWRRPEETREVLSEDGWLRTGDFGRLDDDGYLFITGRKHAQVMLSSGRKIDPQRIADVLERSPYVSRAVVFGEHQPFVSAVLVPALDELMRALRQEAASESLDLDLTEPSGLRWYWGTGSEGRPIITNAHPAIKRLLDVAVDEASEGLQRWARVVDYCLVEEPNGDAARCLDAALASGSQAVTELLTPQIACLYPDTWRRDEERQPQITGVQVGPERLRELLEKESILEAWMGDAGLEFLVGLAGEKRIDAPSLVHICYAAAGIAQHESEEKPLSTAFVVGDPERIARWLRPSQIQLLRQDHIQKMRNALVSLAELVDGRVLTFVVDKHGYLRGVFRLPEEVEDDGSFQLMGPQLRRHAEVSESCDAMVFWVPSAGRQVRVFAEGRLVGRYANGDWVPEAISQIEPVLERLVEERAYERRLIYRVLRCAFRMSEQNQGAIFIVGDAAEVLDRSDAPGISSVGLIKSTDAWQLSDAELINFARQDGATVLDRDGRFRGCMVLLRPDAATHAEIGAGKGARHSSAAKISAEASCLAITVSQDGPITLYESGRRILVL